MNLGLGQINVSDLPQGDSFEPLKAGAYQVQIDSAEMKTTKAGTGTYISIQYKVTGPEYTGRVVFGMITITNPNQEAERIGRQNLGDLCRAVGIANIQDSDQLIGGNLIVTLTVKKDPEYGDKNEVKSYKALDGAVAPTGAQSTGSPAGGAPWSK